MIMLTLSEGVSGNVFFTLGGPKIGASINGNMTSRIAAS